MQRDRTAGGVSRRQVLRAAAAASVAPAIWSYAGAARAAAGHTRKNLESAEGARDLASYKLAISRMLALPPEDPHNWYRNAMVHFLDCPHMNWWFFPWHRGYLGWLEQTLRRYSDDPAFALPYWDWTATPRVPDAMFDGVLTPTDPAYLADFDAFDARFRPTMEGFWNAMTAAQREQQDRRGYATFDDFWTGANGIQPIFPARGDARALTRAKPDLDETTAANVSLATLRSSLSPVRLVSTATAPGFDSGVQANHHMVGGSVVSGMLEHLPHNSVHNDIGGVTINGFMANNMSPVDPVFFMHHGNIDRIWTLWNRKQEALGLSIEPEPADRAAFAAEQFLFFVDAKGNPVSETASGDYFAIGAFDYDYTDGSGAGFIPQLVAAAGAPTEAPPLTILDETFAVGDAALARSGAPQAAATPEPEFAQITIRPPAGHDNQHLLVFVGPAGQPVDTEVGAPGFVASIESFGAMGAMGHHDAMTFTVGLTDALARLRAAGMAVDAGLHVAVVAVENGRGAPVMEGSDEGLVTAVRLGAF